MMRLRQVTTAAIGRRFEVESRRPWLWATLFCALFLHGSLATAFAAEAAPKELTAVVPKFLEKQDFDYGSGTLSNPGRYQQVYAASEFPAGLLKITELRFRPNRYVSTTFTTTIEKIEIHLSTTSKQPGKLSPKFAENAGSDDTVVLKGLLNISSKFAGPEDGPKEFDICVSLTTPFVYDPSKGNFLLDMRHNGSGACGLSGHGGDKNPASRS